jgi:hypothetical protein
MRFPEDIRKSDFQENRPTSKLKEVISDLKEGRDIEGALLYSERITRESEVRVRDT